MAVSFSFCIELSQLYHAEWIDAIRQYRIIALIIGHGFLWSDLICYFVGIIAGAFLELGFNKIKSNCPLPSNSIIR